jgi:hypothetical protein
MLKPVKKCRKAGIIISPNKGKRFLLRKGIGVLLLIAESKMEQIKEVKSYRNSPVSQV